MDLFETILIFAVGFILGELVLAWKIKNAIRRVLDDGDIYFKEEEIESDERTIFAFKVEKIDNLLYMWDQPSNNFVCQANTVEELAKYSKEQNIKYAAVLYNEEIIAFIDGTVANTNYENKTR